MRTPPVHIFYIIKNNYLIIKIFLILYFLAQIMLIIDWKNVFTALWKKFPTNIIMKIIKVIHTFDEYNNNKV